MSLRNNKGQGEIIIRPVLPADAAAIYAIAANHQVARFMEQLPGLEYSQIDDWLSESEEGQYRFAAEFGGSVTGLGWLQCRSRPRISHIGDLKLIVHPNHWGQGMGTSLARTLLDLADNWLNLKRVELDVNTDNPGGFQLYEKFDFAIEGVKRFHTYGDSRWGDSYFMARIR